MSFILKDITKISKIIKQKNKKTGNCKLPVFSVLFTYFKKIAIIKWVDVHIINVQRFLKTQFN